MNRPLAFWSLWLGVIAGVAVLTGTGCSQEEYYCDATGCYYCDGVGCRPVDPPPRPGCRDDGDCPTGSTCTSLGCTAGCATTEDCPDGTVCRDSMCVGPTEPDPTAPPGCVLSSECDAGEICVAGRCETEPVSEGCQFNYECPVGTTCVNERCLTPCMTVAECGADQFCDDGFCGGMPTGACTSAAMCGAGEVCVDGACLDGCTGDADCGAGRICTSAGYCEVGSRPVDPVCAPCAMGHPCVNGLCRTPCATSEECRRFDVQFNFCLEGYCATTNEATSNCMSMADCDGGQNCIDGICR